MENGKSMQNDQCNMLNTALPYIMHIDLNSCFAIIEQQANRLLRGRPVGVSAYDTPHGMIIAASYQAKAKGIKLGVNVAQARSMAPGIVIMTPDPAKYREAHRLFKAVLLEYSPDVTPKSIDEFILDMSASSALRIMKDELRIKYVANHNSKFITHNSIDIERQLHNQAMLAIGQDIKTKIAEHLGEYVTVNIGIGTNRFLAKYGAGFGKPDGMTLIDHRNLRNMYDGMKLVDLPGINTRYRARLRINGIYTPIDFLDADLPVLRRQVFKSIVGYYWYLQLRGHEIETKESKRQSIGHQYALSEKTMDLDKLEPMLLKLCEKTGRRLRKNNLYASGIHLYLGFDQYRHDDPYGLQVDAMQGYREEHSKAYALYDERALERETQQSATSPGSAASFAGRQAGTVQDVGPASFENMHNIKSWHHGEKVYHRLYSTPDIYEAAKRLLLQAEIPNNVKIIAVTVFELQDWDPVQTSLFEQTEDWGRKIGDSPYRRLEVRKRTSDAVDAINDRYGEFVVTPAMMMDMQGTILDRIAFGQVRDM